MSASVVRADALRLPLPDACVDLIVTSPPYFALRSYQDDDGHYDGQIGSEATPADFLVALWRVLDECWRVLKPSGSCWVNLGDKYAGSGGHNNGAYGVSGLHKDRPVSPTRDQGVAVKATLRSAPDRYNQAADVLPKSVMGLPWRFALGASCPDPYRTVYDEGEHPQWINRRPLVWSKPNGLPESVTDRTRANFEDWFMLTKQGRYFSAVDEIREPHLPASLQRAQPHRSPSGVAHQDSTMSQSQVLVEQMCNPLGKLPGSVWTVDYDPWEQLLSGPIAFCPRCGKDLGAGSGRASSPLRATAASPAPIDESSTPTGQATNCSSDQSPAISQSTTCAETEPASTPNTYNSSPDERTSSAEERPSKPTASTATPSPTPTSTGVPTASGVSAGHATLSGCVCDMLRTRSDGPGSVWTVPSEPLIVPASARDHYDLPDHFAAFPQEFARRIILGFSPSGICTACGEGRRPVGDSHVCACNEPMLSPTGSRVGDDPSQLTGRGGLNRPRGDAEGTTSITRWQHNHWAAELRISPHRARIEDVAARLHGPEAFTHWIRTDNSGARPIPAKLREALLRQGWLTEAPAMPDAPTRPPLVIDPFGGTGTVAGVANALGRTGISFDLSGAYCRLARWRIRESGHFAKTASRTDRDRQGSLFVES